MGKASGKPFAPRVRRFVALGPEIRLVYDLTRLIMFFIDNTYGLKHFNYTILNITLRLKITTYSAYPRRSLSYVVN